MNYELYLIDANIATYECYYEFSDILFKLFGSCPRSHKFFYLNDRDPRTDFMKQVAEVDPDFEVENNHQYDFDFDEAKESVFKRTVCYGQQVNFLNYFAKQGGFDAIYNLLKNGAEREDEKLNLAFYSQFTKVFKGAYNVFKTDFIFDFVQKIANVIKVRFDAVSNKEI